MLERRSLSAEIRRFQDDVKEVRSGLEHFPLLQYSITPILHHSIRCHETSLIHPTVADCRYSPMEPNPGRFAISN